MKNILNNKSAISKGLVKVKNSVTIGSHVNNWFARVDENNKYIILSYTNPTGKIIFKNESDFLAHLEGNNNAGKLKFNPLNWSY